MKLTFSCILALLFAAVPSVGTSEGSCDAEQEPAIPPSLRFGIGDAVLANMGRGQWKLGRVVALEHREASWPDGQVAPYMVELNEGGGVYVPADEDTVVRRASAEDVSRMRAADALVERLHTEANAFKAAQLTAASAHATERPGLEAVLRYHAESCHVRPGLYASGGQMDWNNQPNKFRRVLGTESLDLPRSGAGAVLSSTLSQNLWQEMDAIGLLLHDAAGITAWKSQGNGVRYSLRANPSSGALQPLEIYVMGAIGATTHNEPAVPAHYHYNPYWHALERIAPLNPARWSAVSAQLPAGAALVALTSIVWRNAWKYGDPGFRYTHHDVGHQISSLSFAAAAQNATVVLLDTVSDADLAALLRADAPEDPVCLLAVFPGGASLPAGRELDWWRRFVVPGKAGFWDGAPQPVHHGAPVTTYYGDPEDAARPLIAAARQASRRVGAMPAADSPFWANSAPARELPAAWRDAPPLRHLIHNRRSAQSYDAAAAPPAGLPAALFFDMLRRMLYQPAWFPWLPAVQPFLFVHRVEGIEPGVYLLCRGRSCDELRPRLDPHRHHAWQPVGAAPADVPLVMLRSGDVRDAARLGSCVQDIASESAFAVAYLAEHLPALEMYGPWWYKRAHWEACALGGALYLAAGAAGNRTGELQATGIGCFFAPWVQAFLEVDAPDWADVYHFTLGWPHQDSRVDVTGDPYSHVDNMHGIDRDTVDTTGQ